MDQFTTASPYPKIYGRLSCLRPVSRIAARPVRQKLIEAPHDWIMTLELSDDEKLALVRLLTRTSRYPGATLRGST